MSSILRFLNDESGPTAVEYAVMLALIVVVCLVTIREMGVSVQGYFERTDTEMQAHGIGP